jgi:transposase-like protein
MNFREFILNEEENLSNLDVAGMYFNGENTVRSLSKKIGKSIPEIYRIVHSFGRPNRRKIQHDVVRSLADSGMGFNKISEFTGYSKRHIINIIKNGNNT